MEESFQMWGINFIGESNNKLRNGYSWILDAIDYFTKWVEAIRTRHSTSKVVIIFLINNILIRFGFPQKIIVDDGMCFRSKELSNFVGNMVHRSPILLLIILKEMARLNPSIRACLHFVKGCWIIKKDHEIQSHILHCGLIGLKERRKPNSHHLNFSMEKKPTL